MSHRRSYGSHAVARAAEREITPRATIVRDHRRHAIDTAVARSFYCDVLHGRQVWASERTAGRTLWFQIGNDLVAVRPNPGAIVIPARLVVDDPAGIAERCWDAGFTVQVREAVRGRVTFAVIDPFGRRIVLVPNGSAMEAGQTTTPLFREEST